MIAHSQLERRASAHVHRDRCRCAVVLAVCLLATALTGCDSGDGRETGQPDAAAEATPPNVLLVTIDTLRRDRLGFAGYGRDTSPNIDALARESVVFTRAYSQSGWTLPSMASVLTGRAPAEHGATHFHERIDASLPTLATILADRGYATRGFVSHILLRPKHGFGAGFEHFDTSVLALGRPKDVAGAAPITDRALAALTEVPEPFLLWVHYFDPHNEYLAHDDFAELGDDDSGRYDQEIAWTDAQIGRLLRTLDASGRGERTVVVLTADHGEEFGEHDGIYHYTVHEEVVRIPLLVRAPGRAPRVDDTPVQQIDVLPTILGAVGVPVGESLPGRDLLAAEIPPAPIFIERERPARWRQRAMIDGGRKLVVIDAIEPEPGTPPTPTRVENVEPGVYYYDLERDPQERSPIDPAGDPKATAMLEAMARHFEAMSPGAAEAVELSPEIEAALRELGYLE